MRVFSDLPYLCPSYLLPRVSLRALSSPSFSLFVYLGREGSRGREKPVVVRVLAVLPPSYLENR
jgi:hypothetical protein